MTAADRAAAEVRAEWQRRVVAEYGSAAITRSAEPSLSFFCLGETVAVRLFRRLREGATVAVARQALDEATRAWGLLSHAEYRQALEETWDRDYLPRFAEYSIDARAAWQRLRAAEPK